MSDINVLVVFYSRYGNAERIALAAGVGAIQARGNIRLRRVVDHADDTLDGLLRAPVERGDVEIFRVIGRLPGKIVVRYAAPGTIGDHAADRMP